MLLCYVFCINITLLSEKFDFIYVCNGKYAKQKNAVFPNQDKFKGLF